MTYERIDLKPVKLIGRFEVYKVGRCLLLKPVMKFLYNSMNNDKIRDDKDKNEVEYI